MGMAPRRPQQHSNGSLHFAQTTSNAAENRLVQVQNVQVNQAIGLMPPDVIIPEHYRPMYPRNMIEYDGEHDHTICAQLEGVVG